MCVCVWVFVEGELWLPVSVNEGMNRFRSPFRFFSSPYVNRVPLGLICVFLIVCLVFMGTGGRETELHYMFGALFVFMSVSICLMY